MIEIKLTQEQVLTCIKLIEDKLLGSVLDLTYARMETEENRKNLLSSSKKFKELQKKKEILEQLKKRFDKCI
jgi:trehalose-6-phosphate synthase